MLQMLQVGPLDMSMEDLGIEKVGDSLTGDSAWLGYARLPKHE